MCELFGFTAAREYDFAAELAEFFRHSATNPNGWGVAKTDAVPAVVYKETLCAGESAAAKRLLQTLAPASSFLAHIRRATVGSVILENSHPFAHTDRYGRQWVLLHNGTIFNGMELLPYAKTQTGSTDSERILLYLIDKLNALPHAPDYTERILTVENVIRTLANRNKLNLMLYDGELFYFHANMRFTLYYLAEPSRAMFATVPLNKKNWRPTPLCSLLVYRQGRQIYAGAPHAYEYVESLRQIGAESDFSL